MKYFSERILKDGRSCVLRNAEETDAEDFLSYSTKAHGETGFLVTYPDETVQHIDKIRERLNLQKSSANNAEICAFVNGVLVGSAGINILRNRDKLRHRAEFGISILKNTGVWGLEAP